MAQILAGLANPNNIGFTLLNPTSTDQALVSVGGSGATPVGVALDTLVRNLGKTDLSGIDFDASYVLDTSFASFDARIAGNIRLKQDTKASPIAALVDDLMYGQPKTKFTASVGATIDKLRAQATLYHVSGFERADQGQASAFGQTRIGAFDTVDLYFRYTFSGTGITDGLALSLNVKNVLNAVPPVYKNVGQNGYDPSNAFTLGRVFQLGVEKAF
ncbi:TonB-dependent receptor domain-containing protein [Novosphingobium sp. ST904]|uniref:TonB-dependent receptor domain-containing protein n=1 Tax=Novosphingobium sp. ST904 TaxID=1684385 RepID=UPI0006C8A19F|nr:TonB-dependent receptor [Novosphingobium sp. ST904]KPH66081.1 hypothetical protein ADT71_08315 [Novosphingobium sp. ST904]